jgi:hypothetical protein
MPFGDVAFRLDSESDGVAQLHSRLAGRKVEVSDPAEAEAAAGDTEDVEQAGGADDGMAMGGMMGGMNMGGMPGAPQGGGKARGQAGHGSAAMAGMKMDMDATGRFDVAKGRLLGIKGSGSMETDMAGMGGSKTHSRFTLTRL